MPRAERGARALCGVGGLGLLQKESGIQAGPGLHLGFDLPHRLEQCLCLGDRTERARLDLFGGLDGAGLGDAEADGCLPWIWNGI